MPEQDNPQSAITNPKSEIGRRDFLGLAGQGALWATLGASIVALVRFLGFAEAQPPKVYTLDVPETYPRDTLTPVADGYAFIGHDGGGLYAINATCTHLGCLVRTAIPGFECPCHGSQFDGDGQVARGPATQPLVYAVLTLDAGGRVVLDLGQTAGAGFRLLV